LNQSKLNIIRVYVDFKSTTIKKTFLIFKPFENTTAKNIVLNSAHRIIYILLHIYNSTVNICKYYININIGLILFNTQGGIKMVTHVTEKNFDKEILQSTTPVIIDFWAEWCGPCRMMAPVFEDLSKEYEGKIKFVKINTEEAPELAGAFNIRGIPSLSIVNGKEEVNRIVGFAPKEELKKQINETLAKIKKK
jgi:thioredoxin 1